MFKTRSKDAKVGKSMSKTQAQAWIENWTLFVLASIVGQLRNIMNQANQEGVFYPSDIRYILKDCENLIEDIKEEQGKRKVLRNITKMRKRYENSNKL